MAIIRLINTREPGAFRAFQQRLTTVGKIRLGVHNGRYPEKIDTFRFTSPDEQLVRAAADAYGGTAEAWTPQGSKAQQWEVVSEAKALPVYLVHGQSLEPWYEAWAGGRTCVRRCDGITNKITDEACVCIPADGSPSRLAQKELCKPTIRVQVMLQEIPGLGSWMMESHGENAVQEISTFAPLVASAAMPIPAVLRLREESRREWNAEKRKFDSKSFYVPWFDVSVVTSRQVALGGDALNMALAGAGAPVALSGDRRMAIEAAPVSAVPVSAPTMERPDGLPPGPDAGVVFDPELGRKILLDIEQQTTIEGLDKIKAKLKQRGITNPPQKIKDAFNSKRKAVAVATLNHMAQHDPEGLAEALDAQPEEDREKLRELLRAEAERVREDAVDRAEIEAIHRDIEQARPGAGKAERPCFDPWCANSPDTACGHTPQEHLEAHGADALVEMDMAANHDAGRTPGDAWASPYRVLVTGSRTWDDAETIRAALKDARRRAGDRPMVVVHGKCPTGADKIADDWANATAGVDVEAHPADWDVHGKSAGFKRNDEMVTTRPDEVLSFNRGGSNGTKHCTEAAEAAGLNVTRFTDDRPVEPPAPPRRRVTGAIKVVTDPPPVDGEVEGAPSALPMIPDGDYDADEMYTALMTGASKQTPPLTTQQVNALILRTFPVPGAAGIESIDGYDLARLRAGLKSGAVSWT